MELSVVGVLMASDAMGRDDVSDWTAIYTVNRSGPSTDPWGTPTSRVVYWFQKTDAALASQTVTGPVDKTESRIHAITYRVANLQQCFNVRLVAYVSHEYWDDSK